MGARKNPLQQTGHFGDLADINNPFERDLQFRTRKATPYCRHCGETIIESSSDKDGSPNDFEWEIYNRAHQNCHREWAEKEKAKQAEKKELDWDQYMKQHMRE